MTTQLSSRPIVVSLIVTLLLLVATLAMLGWLRVRLAHQEEAQIQGIRRLFEESGILGRPESRSLDFQQMEALLRGQQAAPLRRIYVTKLLREADGQTREILVAPFLEELRNPAWKEEIAWQRLAVSSPPSGYLYLDIDRGYLRVLDASLGVFSLLLIGGLMGLFLSLQKRERKVSELSRELHQRQREILRLERLALVGQLSANIFHDLKKPVLNIRHEVEDALQDCSPTPQEIMTSIQEQTNLFLTMLRELGIETFARGGETEPEWCDLAECLEKSLRLVNYEKNDVRVELILPEEELLILAIPHRLIQLFSNLILNAYQAMNGRGMLRIEAKTAKDRILIALEDDGPGIPESAINSIFEPFQTSKGDQGGSGLGLTICQLIMEDLKGTISVSEGKELPGARFECQFPT